MAEGMPTADQAVAKGPYTVDKEVAEDASTVDEAFAKGAYMADEALTNSASTLAKGACHQTAH